jgi:penicillin-binding protein 1C
MLVPMLSGSKWRNKALRFALLCFCGFLILLMIVPLPDYTPAFSKSVYSKEGHLLSATVSAEQQWCLPLNGPVPQAFADCVRLYEDEYFYFHPGINPVSMLKAMVVNFKSGKIKRGASTLPMQVMRMRNRHAKRNLTNKCLEIIFALKYDLLHSGKEIIRDWAQIAPFGGNTIGLSAASLRYFGRDAGQLSWAEYALLSVMPNSPSSAHLNFNRNILLARRNFLLTKLHRHGYFDKNDLELYMQEDLPDAMKAIPQHAYHFLQFVKNKAKDEHVIHSTIQYDLQKRLNDIIHLEAAFLRTDDIRNIAAVVINVETNELVAYVGNIYDAAQGYHYVDVARAQRSYGSLLKPLLYAHALENNWFLPKEMVADIPTSIGDFRPMNFDRKFRGAVRLDEMLIQSLNVPAVRVLNSTGQDNFYALIRRLGIAGLNKGSDHYGLSIILGGGESTLWDLCRVYKGFARNYHSLPAPFNPVRYIKDSKDTKPKDIVEFSPSTILALTESMADLTRPREEKSWDRYSASNKVAWKTGTSYGHKDAWALGYNARYMVGVWVGNETGEGRHDLTGISKAAPVMFKIFNALPDNQWFSRSPVFKNRELISVCRESGKMAGQLCRLKELKYVERASFRFAQCAYHEKVLLNVDNYLISENCMAAGSRTDTAFVLPAYMEYYYKPGHPEYRGIPSADPACMPSKGSVKVIYPQEGLKVFLPREQESARNQLIATAYHYNKDAKLYWFYDEKYVCTTSATQGHQCVGTLLPGKHILTITDQWGNSDKVNFEIIAE